MPVIPEIIGVAPPDIQTQPAEPATSMPGFLNQSRKRAISHSTVTLPAADVVQLPSLNPNATSAIFVIEAAPGGIPGTVIARFWQDGMWPDTQSGMPIYDGGVIEVQGIDDLHNLRLISADGAGHKLNIQYFS